MNAGFASWLFGMSPVAGALGGMLGTAIGIFIVLAATTFGSALLYAISGFGFAVLAAPLFLLFLDPARAIQLVIIISTALSIVVLRGLLPTIAPWLLLRLALGSLVGLPLGLVAFRYADPILVRAAAGAMIFGFAVLMTVSRRRSGQPVPGKQWTVFAMSPSLDLAAGAVSGVASALVGQPGPPVLIYLLLVGAAAKTVRATLLAFFALLRSDARFPCGDDRHSGPDLACRRYPDPLRLPRRNRRPSDRGSSWRRSLCHGRHWPARGGRGLYPRRRGRCVCHRLATTGRAVPPRARAAHAGAGDPSAPRSGRCCSCALRRRIRVYGLHCRRRIPHLMAVAGATGRPRKSYGGPLSAALYA